MYALICATSTVFVDAGQISAYAIAMSPEQSRAARGWLAWSQQNLAERASVGLSTVRDFEAGRRQPIANNIAAMRRAIEDAGVGLLFSGNGTPIGVAKKNPTENAI